MFFITNTEYKIIKSLLDKLSGLPDTNQRIGNRIIEKPVFMGKEDTEEFRMDTAALAVRGAQFSTEKLLEDELTQRIENGIPVFGMNLKIYGIICLNDPSEELVRKIRKDNRIKLFEYQVSYTEIV